MNNLVENLKYKWGNKNYEITQNYTVNRGVLEKQQNMFNLFISFIDFAQSRTCVRLVVTWENQIIKL